MNGRRSVAFGRRNLPKAPNRTDPPSVRRAVPTPRQPPLAELLELNWTVEARVDERRMMRFIGPDWPAYQGLWLDMKRDGALRPSFCLDAFAFSAAWLLNRKLYAPALVALACRFTVALLAPDQLTLFEVALSLGVGLWGKSLVVRRGMETIGAARSLGLNSREATLSVERAGGTRFWWSVLVAAQSTLVVFVCALGG